MVNSKKLIPYKYTFILLTIALVLISIGIMNKEYIIVLQKAINICMECIGIG